MAGAPEVKGGRQVPSGPTFEAHFSVDQLARLWGLSDDFVRGLFSEEPDVVVFFKYKPGKRTYRTLRIPASVAERVHQRLVRGSR
jgi:hypothetical protein